MSTRICNICSVEKPLDEFHKDKKNPEGRECRCKKCRNARDSQRRKTPEGRAYQREKRRNYSKANRENETQLKREYRKNNPEKYAAHNAILSAILSGKLSKPNQCEYCGDECDSLNGHHDDYAKQLEVVWLCSPCHSKKHSTV